MRPMTGERPLGAEIRKRLKSGELSFREFAELALYYPESGYYTSGVNRVGKGGDYVTAPTLSPVFGYAIGRLVAEFVSRCEGAVCSIVDIGCGDGSLIGQLAAHTADPAVRFFGVDRSLARIRQPLPGVELLTSIDQLPRDGCHFLFSNELFDAFPFTRLVQRSESLHELCVTERDGELDWAERKASAEYDRYFAARGIELADGQFADVSLEWGAVYAELASSVDRGIIVTIDYGFPQEKLFHSRIRRFGTAAAYAGQRVSRDLLANPGEQDLTAHVNFTDLEQAGARHGARTRFFDRLAKFLLAVGITDHELFRPVQEVAIASAAEGLALLEAREEARRLVLPDGIGEDLRVLVQEKDLGGDWSFERPLF